MMFEFKYHISQMRQTSSIGLREERPSRNSPDWCGASSKKTTIKSLNSKYEAARAHSSPDTTELSWPIVRLGSCLKTSAIGRWGLAPILKKRLTATTANEPT